MGCQLVARWPVVDQVNSYLTFVLFISPISMFCDGVVYSILILRKTFYFHSLSFEDVYL